MQKWQLLDYSIAKNPVMFVCMYGTDCRWQAAAMNSVRCHTNMTGNTWHGRCNENFLDCRRIAIGFFIKIIGEIDCCPNKQAIQAWKQISQCFFLCGKSVAYKAGKFFGSHFGTFAVIVQCLSADCVSNIFNSCNTCRMDWRFVYQSKPHSYCGV